MGGPIDGGHGEATLKIGEVAERTELSIRSLRHWDEVGLVSPSAHSPGGFRLYTEADVERILLIRRMKPLGFSLERMADFCRALDALGAAGAGPLGSAGTAGGRGSDDDNAAARATITEIGAEAAERLERLRKHLAYAEEFVEIIDRLS